MTLLSGSLEQPNTDELCRRCGKEPETIQHIAAACEQLAPTEYVKRHEGAAKVVHQKLAEAAELMVDKSPFYRYRPANASSIFMTMGVSSVSMQRASFVTVRFAFEILIFMSLCTLISFNW